MKRMMPYKKPVVPSTDGAKQQQKAVVARVGLCRRKESDYKSAIKAEDAQDEQSQK